MRVTSLKTASEVKPASLQTLDRPGAAVRQALVERGPFGPGPVTADEQKPSGAEQRSGRSQKHWAEEVHWRHTLISTSTPLGSSSCMSESTVSLLDERMSMRRLW